MANALYTSAKAKLTAGEIDWTSDNFKLALMASSHDYTPKPSDKTLADVPAGAIVGTPQALKNTRITGHAADADAVVFDDMGEHQDRLVDGLLIYREGSNPATSELIAYIDTAHGTLPLITNGGDVRIGWSNGPNKIFALPKAGTTSEPKE